MLLAAHTFLRSFVVCAGARLAMQDVTVLQTPSVCEQQQQQQGGSTGNTALVSTEGHLFSALSDADVSRVVVSDDITLTKGLWQVRLQPSRL